MVLAYCSSSDIKVPFPVVKICSYQFGIKSKNRKDLLHEVSLL